MGLFSRLAEVVKPNNRPGRLHAENKSSKEVVATQVVNELFHSNVAVYNKSETDKPLIVEINKLKGTDFDFKKQLTVKSLCIQRVRNTNRPFDVKLMHLVMNDIVSGNYSQKEKIHVNIDDPKEVDEAWNRYFAEFKK